MRRTKTYLPHNAVVMKTPNYLIHIYHVLPTFFPIIHPSLLRFNLCTAPRISTLSTASPRLCFDRFNREGTSWYKVPTSLSAVL
uniref:Uncharacterized protein n=1 Tax=Anguilla anguilla TaxID=7936 RepID=A0A0E9RLA2_ANGAN